MIMNRLPRKATRGRLLFLLRCLSELYNPWAGLPCVPYFFEFHEFCTCTQSPCLPSCGRETGMQREKMCPCQHVAKSFLGGIATVMHVLAGRNGMRGERRGE
ncbi:hypothetical protein TcCL_NonESM05689 [Trypanosoma cruzi]|nr:hypothetical protein TcCL_NonESM05689 [Trypanosoma cruzi]